MICRLLEHRIPKFLYAKPAPIKHSGYFLMAILRYPWLWVCLRVVPVWLDPYLTNVCTPVYISDDVGNKCNVRTFHRKLSVIAVDFVFLCEEWGSFLALIWVWLQWRCMNSRRMMAPASVMIPVYFELSIVITVSWIHWTSSHTHTSCSRSCHVSNIVSGSLIILHYTRLLHPFKGRLSATTWVSRYQKGKPIWISLKQETVSGSGISWAICKSAPSSRQITMPAPNRCFLQARCPSCRQPNNDKALKATGIDK